MQSVPETKESSMRKGKPANEVNEKEELFLSSGLYLLSRLISGTIETSLFLMMSSLNNKISFGIVKKSKPILATIFCT